MSTGQGSLPNPTNRPYQSTLSHFNVSQDIYLLHLSREMVFFFFRFLMEYLFLTRLMARSVTQ